ncbi:ATP-binding protein [Nostoc sp.]
MDTFRSQQRYNHIQLQLAIQSWLLVIFSNYFLNILLKNTKFPIHWQSVIISVFFSIGYLGNFFSDLDNEIGKVHWLGSFIGFNIILAYILNVLTENITVPIDEDIIKIYLSFMAKNSVSLGILFGLINGVIRSLAYKKNDNEFTSSEISLNLWAKRVVFVIVITFFLRLYLLNIIAISLIIYFFIAFFIANDLARYRLDDWLINILLSQLIPSRKNRLFAHITSLRLPYLSSQLTNWLLHDWESGLYNINQVLAYSLQLFAVTEAINRALAQTPPEQLLLRLSQLSSEHLEELRYTWEGNLESYSSIRFDTQYHAALYGFWKLYKINDYRGEEYREKGYLQEAIKAFYEVRYCLYGEEMFTLTQTLAAFLDADELVTIAMLQSPTIPPAPLLRHPTWEALDYLVSIIQDARTIQRSASPVSRSFALKQALQKLKTLSEKTNSLLQYADIRIVQLIASSWEKSLLRVAEKLKENSITEHVRNPYIVGNPVEGKRFVGREDVMRQLEELWIMEHQLQSVVLYGHRRMGKTSILVNVANRLESQIQLAYVNLLRLGDSPQGVGEVLMAICDEISQTVKLPPPSDADLLNLPYRTFERYLKQVEAQLDGGLIIALDEFEKIEDLIEAKKIPVDFMGFLRGLVQMSSKIAFAFAGLHTLEEMTTDYFQPFFASVIPIHVGFQERAATRQILANPGDDFPLDYTLYQFNMKLHIIDGSKLDKFEYP